MKKVMAEKIDHVMICVRNLDKAIANYSSLFDTVFYRLKPVALDGLGVGAAAMEGTGLELVEASDLNGKAAKFIDRMGEACWGFAIKVPVIEDAIEAMVSQNVTLLSQDETLSRKVAVFEPEDTHGVMIKLVEYLPAYGVGGQEVVKRWCQTNGRPEPQLTTGMLENLDHFICYVDDVEKARKRFGDLLLTRFPEPHGGTAGSTRMSVDGLGIELICGKLPEQDKYKTFEDKSVGFKGRSVGAVAALFVERRKADGYSGEGMGAISIRVTDFNKAIESFKSHGLDPIAVRNLPTRKVALYEAGGDFGTGFEIIQWKPLAHPIVCSEMARQLTQVHS